MIMIEVAKIEVFGYDVGNVLIEDTEFISKETEPIVLNIKNFQPIIKGGQDVKEMIYFFNDIRNIIENILNRIDRADYIDKNYEDVAIDLFNELDELNKKYNKIGFKILDVE
jgi:hypothetical protein